MNYYETLYIVHPALESGRLKDIVLSIGSIFSNNKANILNTHVWGKKKLAYMIDKQKYGTYILVQFESDGQEINTISTELEINPNILAHLTTKISDADLNKDASSLDDQISGDKTANSSENDNKENSSSSSDDSEDQNEGSKEETVSEDSTEGKKDNIDDKTSKEESEEENGAN